MDPVLAALRRAAQTRLMPPRSAILLAVSGGPDSMALFHGCRELAEEMAWRLTVAHVHHGWRGRDADRDQAFVADRARRAELPFLHRRRDTAAVARALGLSPEAAARRERYAALAEMAREAGAARVAVAHHAGDVAESHLLARERRGGTHALAGPRARRDDGVVRPLLETTRAQILAFLAGRGEGFRRDASNGDLRRPRNRARRELAAGGPEAAERVARDVSAHVRRREAIDRAWRARAASRVHRGPGATLADAAYLARCDRELARRSLTEAAAPYARAGRPPLTGREREQILDRLAAGGDFRFEAGRRIRFERRGALLTVSPRADAARGAPAKV